MSHPASNTSSAASARQTPTPKFIAFMTAIGAIVLIGSEIWLAALAAIWAADGFFGLGLGGDLVMVALVIPLAIWATWMTVKLAIAAEMDPENAD